MIHPPERKLYKKQVKFKFSTTPANGNKGSFINFFLLLYENLESSILKMAV